MSVPALLLPYVSAETVYAVPAAALMAVLAALTVRDFRRRASDGKRTRRVLTLGACGIALSAASGEAFALGAVIVPLSDSPIQSQMPEARE